MNQDEPNPPVKSLLSKNVGDYIQTHKVVLLILTVLFFILLLTIFFLNTQVQTERVFETVSPAPNTPSPEPTVTLDMTAWKTYRNESLQYEFNYPPDPIEPMRELGDTSFVIGYFLDGGNTNDIRDVQNPDKTYWISLGYISQKQLSVMGITYCGANPNDSSRCELLTIDGQTSTIDWKIPVEYTKINDNGKEEKATQVKASVWIPDPKGGIVTFDLQPVTPKSKETLYKILSTFRFLDQNAFDQTVDWETYTSYKLGFSLQYPKHMKLEERDNVVYLTVWGPTQRTETEFYDGISLSFSYGPLGNRSLKEYVDIHAQHSTTGAEILIPPAIIVIIGISGYSYRVRGAGDFSEIYLPFGSDGYFRIIDGTADPTGKGFQKTVNEILSTFRFL